MFPLLKIAAKFPFKENFYTEKGKNRAKPDRVCKSRAVCDQLLLNTERCVGSGVVVGAGCLFRPTLRVSTLRVLSRVSAFLKIPEENFYWSRDTRELEEAFPNAPPAILMWSKR